MREKLSATESELAESSAALRAMEGEAAATALEWSVALTRLEEENKALEAARRVTESHLVATRAELAKATDALFPEQPVSLRVAVVEKKEIVSLSLNVIQSPDDDGAEMAAAAEAAVRAARAETFAARDARTSGYRIGSRRARRRARVGAGPVARGRRRARGAARLGHRRGSRDGAAASRGRDGASRRAPRRARSPRLGVLAPGDAVGENRNPGGARRGGGGGDARVRASRRRGDAADGAGARGDAGAPRAAGEDPGRARGRRVEGGRGDDGLLERRGGCGYGDGDGDAPRRSVARRKSCFVQSEARVAPGRAQRAPRARS